MAPRKKHGYTVVVFDNNSSPEYKENAIECYKKINELKFFEFSKDGTKLYLANTLNVDNPSKKSVPVIDDEFFHPTSHQNLQNAECVNGNLLEAIEIAANDLKFCSEEGLYELYKLVVFSDFKSKKISRKILNNTVKVIVKILNEINANIYFFGIDFEVNALLDTKKSVYDYMQRNVDKLGGEFEIALRIVKESYGVISPFELAVDLFFSYSFSKRGYPYSQPLDINGWKIPTACVKFFQKQFLLCPKSVEYPGKTFVLADRQDEEVDRCDIRYGLLLHDKFLFIPQDVRKGLASLKKYVMSFKLLGFTDSKNVPDHYLRPSMNLVTVNERMDPSIGFLNYLIEAAEKFNKYGIALKVHQRRKRPKLFALIPKTSPHYFILKELPYAEDFQILYNETDPKTVKVENVTEEIKSEGIEEVVFDFLDSICLDGKLKLHPFMRVNDCRKRQASLLGKKVFGEELLHEDEQILGLRFDDKDVLAKLDAVPISTTSLTSVTIKVDHDDPWYFFFFITAQCLNVVETNLRDKLSI